jgi:hypothetical protein
MDLKTLFTPFPILSSPHLVLRALHPIDLDDLNEYASDPEIVMPHGGITKISGSGSF